MFVQHMLASLKSDGLMATVMPHGVLFRGGKEKLIREILINDDVIEAIISLPPGLFYGTGIPACVIVANKSKPETMKGKILFINADREYAEGKAQNKLRPEDIEKIEFVFSHKREIPKYSRIVKAEEIIETHDYNLNIRRYVDNTPDPEPEDVQAHLIGGIPESEVLARSDDFSRFRITPNLLFRSERPSYLAFHDQIETKSSIKASIEADSALKQTFIAHKNALEDWWKIAREDFSKLRSGKKMPEVRQELLTTLKNKCIPLNILDEFKSAGVFVNWWQQIRFDLKTIISTGWHHTLIPDEFLQEVFFKKESKDIEILEARLNEAQSELSEVIETVQGTIAYEPEEDEKITPSTIKKALNELIDDLKGSNSDSARKEFAILQTHEKGITKVEKNIKDIKATLKIKVDELDHKLKLKRIGSDEFKAESSELIRQVNVQVTQLDINNKEDKKKISALNKDKTTLEERLAKTDGVFISFGGQLMEDEARQLILNKLYGIAEKELNRYFRHPDLVAKLHI